MRTTLVVLFLALTVNLNVVSGQSIDEAANNGHPDHVFGMFAEQDLEAVAASYTERLASPEIRIDLPDGNLWLSQADQPVPESSGGNRFGGPLVWTMVIIAATTVGFVYMGTRLSAGVSVAPGEE